MSAGSVLSTLDVFLKEVLLISISILQFLFQIIISARESGCRIEKNAPCQQDVTMLYWTL